VVVDVEQVVPGASSLGCLLIHGLTGTPAEMAPVAERLAGRHPLWVSRIAGHATAVEDLAVTSWRDWYRSAEAGADALAAATPRIVAIGLSMGALLALRLAAERPETVAAVVLLSPAMEIRRVAPWLRRPLRLFGEVDARLATVRRLLGPLGFPKAGSDIADAEVRRMHPGYRRVPLRALLNLLHLQHGAAALAPAVRQPALVVHALQDHTCPVAGARALHAALGSREKTLVLLAESFHVVTVDCERERVLAEIERFLAGLETRGAQSSTELS
jgi:carboxylesterase